MNKNIYANEVTKMSAHDEYCLVFLKPGYANNEHHEIPYIEGRIWALGLQIADSGYALYNKELARKHYSAHVEKSFYPSLEEYITSDVVYGIIVYGPFARVRMREIIGSTKNPANGTIRCEVLKYYPNLTQEEKTTKNVVHCTDEETDPWVEISVFQDARANYEKNNESNID